MDHSPWRRFTTAQSHRRSARLASCWGPDSTPDHILGRQWGDTVVRQPVSAAGQGVARVARWIYVLAIDTNGRGADEAQLACLLFGLDLDDFNLVWNAFLVHDLA